MNDQHIASAFDRDLEKIQAQIMKMGGLVENAILEAAVSLEARDEERAEQVRRNDKAIDALEESINEEAARVIALRAPAAIDLRVVLSVMKVSGNLERIGLVKIVEVSPNSTRLPRWKNAVFWLTRAACCMEWVTITTE